MYFFKFIKFWLYKEKSLSNFEKILQEENNYLEDLFSFISTNSQVYITKGIYKEAKDAIPIIRRRTGNLAFFTDSTVDFRKKVGRLQRNYFNILKLIGTRVIHGSHTIPKFNSEYNIILEEIRSKYKDINDNDVLMYIFASLNKNKNSVIITRDYDFLKIRNICKEKKLNGPDKIYIPLDLKWKLSHNYEILN